LTPPRILALLVLYNRKLSESESWTSLRSHSEELFWLIQNNGATPVEVPAGFKGEAINAPDNPGIAAAYGNGIAFAERNGFTHLLFLDQDTSFPESFAERQANSIFVAPEAGCWIPTVRSACQLISPLRWIWERGFPLRQVPEEGELPLGRRSFINSGALFSVKLLQSIWDSDSERLFLDAVDHLIAHKLRSLGVVPYLFHSEVVQDYSNDSSEIESQLRRLMTSERDYRTFGEITGTVRLQRLWLLVHRLKLALRFKSLRFLR